MGTRRTHSLEFKQGAVKASDQAGVSIAGVAMAHGINANQLHKWRRQLLATKVVVAQPQMLPVTITPAPASMPDAPSAQEGCIDIQFSRARVSVRGRVDPHAQNAGDEASQNFPY
ncbi:MAG: transposase [Betaproteobacteria bacterium]|jgi:transposase|uniref:IS66-like element accessory protein TnpA n=1 Tax=Dokdonella sp. TaxID=2291710 RepID=UPI002DD69603|nr:transposase [Dokdonella sp.]MBK6358152.1 transposase [Betaproteobacteria bacterium]MBK7464287.1 transposase [Betaproteobacteria bacterium]MCC7225873.1 transposase [Burkholderiaceae bacterium]